MKNFKYDEIKQDAVEKLGDLKGSNIYGCDLHNEIFNIDYYIIGRYNAEQWLADNVFYAIELIREYEEDNFGEVTTDFSEPERVVNMYVYILGEEILQESETLSEKWDNILTDEDLQNIINDLS